MTRIIAGKYRGVQLLVPKKGTRPTADKVREAVFSTLQARGALDQARVLDLFAGSGALAIEALSRGALQADLVEKSVAASKQISVNLRKNQIKAAKLSVKSAESFVTALGEKPLAVDKPIPGDNPPASGKTIQEEKPLVTGKTIQEENPNPEEKPAGGAGAARWELVFLDPPYDYPSADLERLVAQLHPHLDPDAWVVVERSSRSENLRLAPSLYEEITQKDYGETRITYYRPALT